MHVPPGTAPHVATVRVCPPARVTEQLAVLRVASLVPLTLKGPHALVPAGSGGGGGGYGA